MESARNETKRNKRNTKIMTGNQCKRKEMKGNRKKRKQIKTINGNLRKHMETNNEKTK